jgi:RNA polymerase sigma-70 factor (ECF subfamily)
VPINKLMATLISLRRKREDTRLQAMAVPGTRGPATNHSEITRAFEQLPLADREVLALIAVEHLAYEEAAAALDISLADFISRLTRARTSLARVVDGERHVVLRVVK